ncbi:unnamed protein product [Diatraea saccharalis]|uniref:Zinc finger DNA binding protein n=1 Tax=Diatraea saccharalis TaxID=40085 RepID=A0A9N9R576_9NEOP|nr:unnamed protein product [Diatraea saccharalis]
MNPARSPPQYQAKQATTTVSYYGSDSAINEMTQDCNENKMFINSKRQKRSLFQSTPSESSSQSGTEIKRLFDELRTQQEQKFESLNSAINVVITQNQEIGKTMEFMSKQYDDLLLKITNLEKENINYKKKVELLENKIDMLEKNTHNSTVEIRNIPLQKNETRQIISQIVKDIGCAVSLSTPIQDLEIRDIYRTKAETIVVDFSTTQRKESLMLNLKKLNKSKRSNKEPMLNTLNIKLSGPNKTIYISEYLTHKARRLFFLARENVKMKKLAAAWSSYGKIYVKKQEDQPPKRIDTEDDLIIASK